MSSSGLAVQTDSEISKKPRVQDSSIIFTMDISIRVHYPRHRSSETVLEKLPGMGIITRNRYGAEILNADSVMFVDWDVPSRNMYEFVPKPQGFLASLRKTIFGLSPTQDIAARQAMEAWIRTEKIELEAKVIRKIDELDLNLRLYETRNGFRGIVTSSLFQPEDSLTQDLMTYLEVDKLYARLCRFQGTFRVRLTPKFWRIGIQERPVYKPVQDQKTLQFMQRWVEMYNTKSSSYATARFIKQIGTNTNDPVILETINLHDTRCKALQALELA
jgi:hypothetical protein